jgi:3-keto-5-aminohexanoate cleavage enzyme
VLNKYIMNVCLTGMIASKKENLYIPISPEEIANDVEKCVALGASIVHVHARDEHGQPTYKKEYYERIIRSIREVSPDVVICVSTSGRQYPELEKRIECLDTDPAPDMASLTMGSIDFPQGSTLNSMQTVRAIAQAMSDRGIRPEIEIFDIGMARNTQMFMREHIFKGPCYANIILGNMASADASLLDLSVILSHLPQELVWCAGGIGRTQIKANMLGMLYGHGVRVGLEDALYMEDRKKPASNGSLAERIVALANHLGKTPYTISETRHQLGLATHGESMEAVIRMGSHHREHCGQEVV